MAHLYGGNILLVDLGRGEITKEPTSNYTSSFLGGRGINIKLFYDHIKKGTDPLSAENVIVFGVGPLGGTTLSSGRTEVTAKSPETGLLGSSNFGGFWGGELKYAGYDHIVIKGKADKPVYIRINNDQVEIMDAKAYWGKDAYETQDLIRKDLDNPDVKIACIGQAGENLVRFSTIQHELGNSAGRTGMGTVMGSKNLKAIVIRGTNQLTVADPQKLLDHAAQLAEIIKKDPECQRLSREGVAAFQEDAADPELLKEIVRGCNGDKVPSMLAVAKSQPSKRTGCQGCPVQCMELFQVDGVGKGAISCELYPEWSVVVGCTDTATSLECAILCQRYGIDCITAAETIHWLMELYEDGVISAEDTDGIPMEWGSTTAIRSMLDKMVFREGIGDILAQGILPAAKKIGRGSADYVEQTRGMPLTELQNSKWLPAFRGTSLAAVVGARGDTMRSLSPVAIEMALTPEDAKKITGTEKAVAPEEYEGKPELVKYSEDVATLSDVLSLCKWQSRWFLKVCEPEQQADLLSAGSGKEISVETLFDFANKIRTLEHAYEIEEGLSREKQRLPERFYKIIESGPSEGEQLKIEKFEEMKTKYYELRGWDGTTGVPTEKMLKRYGLDDVAQNLKNLSS